MRKEMFDHEITILRDTFGRLLRRQAHTNLIKLINKTHPADLSIVFRYFNDDEQLQVFNIMKENEHTAEFLVELDDTLIANLLEDQSPERIAALLEQAPANDQSYILGTLEDEQAQSVIELLKTEEQEEIEELMGYPEDSAGAMMTTDVFTLYQESTCRDALKTLQDQEKAEMVFYLYITDEDDGLVGVASLRALATTPSDTLLKDIMIKRVHSVRPETDQEDVAQIVAQYNYLAVPVLDADGHLIGLVTVDDVVDVIREEATEDFLQMAGAGKDREILLKSSWENAKARLPWLFASWIGGIIAVSIIGRFEYMLENIIALAAFIPVIIGMGGNIGTQSSTIIVRGMATGRIKIGSEIKILMKEIRVGLILGGLYGLMLGVFAKFRFIDADPMLGVVVGLSIGSSMLIAVTVGTFIPMFLRKIDIDPAIATGPFVTTSIDILGVLLYFVIAGSLLAI
ncbi:MAG: magnesium transporter [Candidatus Marinimicrobia bacterium]|jgi:magnesium transporter|nr:magnesium transporter [Candidatus Neomarinimicrobiota bacterium]MBT3848969.1 magnesium transporter [Candidatus Neomarinimicrobiota bacterium]MBT4154266.1 magnesium transporter [Candidatus Neomarinimicrobiota bacterium]MBT4555872.1 magnesium transporter [Candidatus Neomarinimicrobiota bacterium]MBT4754041.1 magnesium transporter [Candidatus Neomarinimicrobiota bacterium]